MPIKRRIAKSICLFVLLLVIGCTAPPKVKVDVLPGFDALFDNRKGWTGADGAYSLSLSDAPDELIITYVANSTDFYKMAADARLYRPRFIRVRFKGAEIK